MGITPKNNKNVPDTRIEPLPCVSADQTPAIPHRVTLTECSWPFLGSFVLNAVLCELLFFPLLQPPTVVISQTPAVLWFSPFIVPGVSGSRAEIPDQPAVAFVQHTKTAEPAPVESPEYAVTSDRPATLLASASTTGAETAGNLANTDSIVIQPPPKARSKADRHQLDPTPAPRQTAPLSAPVVSRTPAAPSPEPPREQLQALPAVLPDIKRAEREHSHREQIERQNEEDRESRELAAQKRAFEESARQEQLAREQAQQAVLDQSKRERVAAEKSRQAREAQEQLLRERKLQEEMERRKLAAQKRELAEIARQEQLVRKQAQQAVLDQSERERVAAEKIRQEQEAQEKLQKESRIQEEQRWLAAERARQVQRVREQEQQALREQAERKHAAAEKSQQVREAQEQLLRERKLLEELEHRKRMVQTREQPKPKLLAAATKQREIAASGTPEKRTEKRTTQQPQKGLFIPPLKGDLKLVISGTALPKITISFKDFALSRRDRPFSRVEARHATIITPVIANTQEKRREVVIEKARPGVYTITVEPVAGSSDFTCLLKLHEGASGTSVRECGRHTIAQKKVLLKILMPDGIMWDDSTVFTGSMEDSDGVTKFNTATGLMWKEYSD